MQFESLQALSADLAGVVEKVKLSTVRVDARNRVAGTGIIWSSEGAIVTADHVVEREENIVVQIGESSYDAELAGRDPSTDLAVLRVKATNLVAAEVADSKALRPGNIVVAAGKPWGENPIVSFGIVSSLGRPGVSRGWGWGEQFRDGLIQTDVVLYPGFSGGPLADASGRIVGINTSGIGRGMSFAIPTETASRVAAELLKEGRIRRGYLGVGIQKIPLAEGLRQKLGVKQETGLMVLTVEPGSAAEKGGVLPGDIIIGANDTPLARVRELHRWLSTQRAGQSVKLHVIRGGELAQLQVAIAER